MYFSFEKVHLSNLSKSVNSNFETVFLFRSLCTFTRLILWKKNQQRTSWSDRNWSKISIFCSIRVEIKSVKSFSLSSENRLETILEYLGKSKSFDCSSWILIDSSFVFWLNYKIFPKGCFSFHIYRSVEGSESYSGPVSHSIAFILISLKYLIVEFL